MRYLGIFLALCLASQLASDIATITDEDQKAAGVIMWLALVAVTTAVFGGRNND